MNQSRITQLLVDCRSEDPDKQWSAIRELENIVELEEISDDCTQSIVRIMLEFLKSSNECVRCLAIETLGYIRTDDLDLIGSELVKMLADPELLVRDDAVNAIARLNYSSAIDAIQLILQNDPEWIVRASAAEALGDLAGVEDIETLRVLESALDDPMYPVRGYAANAIGLIGNSTCLAKLQSCEASEEILQVRSEMLIALYRLGERERLKDFLEILSEAEEDYITGELNTLDELINRRVPDYLFFDIPLIEKTLVKVMQDQDFEFQHGEVKKILEQLQNLKAFMGVSYE